ncbi:MAG TPA: alpha-L-arabinofuranosidase C-terminal domain-containing protein [Thermogutta sp.]|nr:alpha-L-arabinofuranosidase C-terminal domain-containing protein [Thermogutta sp.]
MNVMYRLSFLARMCALSLVANIGLLARGEERTITLTVHPKEVLNTVDVNVYGHFLEHIYHSVNGGLWGELVWNRSFEHHEGGRWQVIDQMVIQKGLATNQRLVFGDPEWEDYEFTLEAQKLGGEEGFLILFRVRDETNFYWCNLGGWGNRWHQLERGRSGEGRWYPVGPRVAGQIDSKRWYRIRIRCEGDHFRVWLDDQQIIEFRDPQGHRKGAVGIGTWATQAGFRNLRVTDLAGKELFAGIPEVGSLQQVAKHWRVFGQGRAFLDDNQPLNSDWSQRLESQGGETGLEQQPFALKANEWYVGSLWIRGNTEQNPVIRLMNGPDIIAMQSLPRPGEEWQEVPIRLRSTRDVDSATLQIAFRGPGRLWIDQVSLMPESWLKAGGYRPDLLQAVADLQPPVIRWPGGCFASAYRWKDGIGPQAKRRSYPREIWDDIDVNSFGTDEFIEMCRRVGAEPLIVVNIGTPQWNPGANPDEFLQDILDWIEYCNGPADSKWGRVRAENGHPQPYGVKYWEIDNETWGMTAERYAAAVRRIAPLMRAKDPTIKLAACGSGGMGESAHRWNRVIIEQCAELIDYLSIHHYENPDRFADGPRNYEEFFRATGELIARSKNPNLKLYVSEWNAQSTDWRTGLYCGGILNAFERTGNIVGMAAPALFLRHVSATAWDNAFINFDHRKWFPAPNYVVMQLWRRFYLPNRIRIDGDTGRLNAVATASEDGRRVVVKIVNPTEVTHTLRVQSAGGRIAAAQAVQVAADRLMARNTLDNPSLIRPQTLQTQLTSEGATVVVPRYGCVIVEMELK